MMIISLSIEMKGVFRMAGYIKNIPIEEIFSLTDQVEYLPGQVVSRTISQNDAQSLTIFAFDKGEEISSHSSHGDPLITVLDGEGRVTIDGKQSVLHQGESILMPAGKPHTVFATEKFKNVPCCSLPAKEKDGQAVGRGVYNCETATKAVALSDCEAMVKQS